RGHAAREHLEGRMPGTRDDVADLTILVVAPAPCGAVDDRAAVRAARGDRLDARPDADDPDRPEAHVAGRAIAELAVASTAPAPGGTADDRAGVEIASRDRLYPVDEIGNLHRHKALGLVHGRPVVAELAVAVGAPAPGRSTDDSAGVEPPGGHGMSAGAEP